MDDKIKFIAIFAGIFLILCGYFYLTNGRRNLERNLVQVTTSGDDLITIQPTKKSGTLYRVHVAGEVKNPGVYSVDSKLRIVDLIEIAGGATENADLDRINLAETIRDGEKIRVPNINDPNQVQNFNLKSNQIENITSQTTRNNNYVLDSSTDSNMQSGLININTASLIELQTLPGVGATIATSIIEYRTQNGNFQSIQDLKKVSRIGDKIFAKLENLITVD